MFAEYFSEGLSAETSAVQIRECGRSRYGDIDRRRLRVSTDPAGNARTSIGPTVRGEYERAGLIGRNGLESWGQAKKQEGLQLIEALLRSADGTVSLRIHPRCEATRPRVSALRTRQRGNQWMDYAEDPQHPHEDLIDPFGGGLKLEFPEGRTPPPAFDRDPGGGSSAQAARTRSSPRSPPACRPARGHARSVDRRVARCVGVGVHMGVEVVNDKERIEFLEAYGYSLNQHPYEGRVVLQSTYHDGDAPAVATTVRDAIDKAAAEVRSFRRRSALQSELAMKPTENAVANALNDLNTAELELFTLRFDFKEAEKLAVAKCDAAFDKYLAAVAADNAGGPA